MGRFLVSFLIMLIGYFSLRLIIHTNLLIPSVKAQATSISLKVQNSNPSFGGKPYLSGMRSTMIPPGNDWNNPMNIIMEVVPQSPATSIKEYDVAFYNKQTGSLLTNSPTFISDVQNRISGNLNNGFLLNFDVPSSQYRVYNNCTQSWVNITSSYTINKDTCGGQYTLVITPISNDQTGPFSATWQISFIGGLGSITYPISLYTAAYAVENTNNIQFSSSINPIQQ